MQASQAMSKHYLKVSGTTNVMEAISLMQDNRETCALVVDAEDMLEGILTLGDVRRGLSRKSANTSIPLESNLSVPDVCLLSAKCFRHYKMG